MKVTLAAAGCIIVLGVSLSHAADYFIYEDPAGNIVLSNLTPPPSAAIVRREQLPDVSDEAVRAAREREERFWHDVRIEDLAASNERLAESNHRLAQAISGAVALRGAEPNFIVQQVVETANRRSPSRFHAHRPRLGRRR